MSHGNRKRAVVSQAEPRRGVPRSSRKVIRPYVPRLIMDANCTTCGPVGNSSNNPASIPELAMRHTAATGHVVILNGAVDDPDHEFANVSV
jgi:hypothetical protein